MKFLVICLQLILHICYGQLNGTVDMSYGFDNNTIYWPGMPTFNLEEVEPKDNPFFEEKKLGAAEHGGTHLDAPYHFNPNGWTVADIPLDRLIVPGVLIQKREASAQNSDTEVMQSDLEDWEKANGPLPEPVAVIFDFGWSSKYQNKTEYLGIQDGDESVLHFPGISEGAANWLVKSGKVVGVGVDTASIDRGNNTDFIAHQLLTAANIYLMENLDLSKADLPPRGFQVIVMPMKIINGTGAPLRIVARPDPDEPMSILYQILAWVVSIWVSVTGTFK